MKSLLIAFSSLTLCSVLSYIPASHAVDQESVGEEAAEVQEETAEYEAQKKKLYLKEKQEWIETMNTDYTLLQEEIEKSGHAQTEKNRWMAELDKRRDNVYAAWKRMEAINDTSWKESRDNFEQYIAEFKTTAETIRQELRLSPEDLLQRSQQVIIQGTTGNTSVTLPATP